MECTVKVNIDADDAIEKLERIKELYKEINELQKEKPIVNLTIRNESDIDLIKSHIDDKNNKNTSFDLM